MFNIFITSDLILYYDQVVLIFEKSNKLLDLNCKLVVTCIVFEGNDADLFIDFHFSYVLFSFSCSFKNPKSRIYQS